MPLDNADLTLDRIQFLVSEPKDVVSFSYIILRNRLHLSGNRGCLKARAKAAIMSHAVSYLTERKTFSWVRAGVKHSRPQTIIALAYCDEEVVGCFYLFGTTSHFYVRPKFRNIGIAKELFIRSAQSYDLSEKVVNYGHTKVAKKLITRLGIAENVFGLRPQI